MPITAILIGAGQRGALDYAPYALRHPDELQFVAVAEPVAERRQRFAHQYGLSPENVYESWEALLARPKMADAALICTPDQQHTAPALTALQAGYDVLLEKPMATRQEECIQLVETAEGLGRQLHICHVLRYTRHAQTIREIIQSGILGEIINIDQRENVAYWHMAHSYVRGNWANSAISSPMILTKCCHDFDLLLWWLERRCERLSSVGSLRHFRPENAPAGAPQRCLDGCPAEKTCPYYAPFLYLDLVPLWRSFAATASGFPRRAMQANLRTPGLVKVLGSIIPSLRQVSQYRGWPRSVVTVDPTPENVLEALRHGPYGRCVYHCGNDVVDHQSVLMQFEGAISVTLSMHGHSHIEYRTTRIEGTRGALLAELGLGGAWVEIRQHRSGKIERLDTSHPPGESHGGGDEALLAAFNRSLRSGESQALTLGRQSLQSHLLAFAAEQARLSGTVLKV
mgnify:FL=1